MKRVLVLVKKEFIQLLRDRRILPLLFVAPVIQMIIFGTVAKTEVKKVPLFLVDNDISASSRHLVDSFVQSGYFELVGSGSSEAEARKAVAKTEASLALFVPSGFERNIQADKTAEVWVVIDGSDSNSASQVQSYVSRIIGSFSSKLLSKKFVKLKAIIPRVIEVEPRVRIWYNPELKSVNYFVPGLIGMILGLLLTTLTSLAIVKEREKGTLEQILVTPIKRWEFISGKVIPYVIVGLIEVNLVFSAAVNVFKVPFRGSFPLFLFACLVFLIPSVSLGLLVSAFSKTQQQAEVTSWLFNFPSMMLSGFIFPIANMPLPIRFLTYFIPLRYFLSIVRSLFLKGSTFWEIWPQFLAMLLLGSGIFLLSVARFRKRLED